MSTILNLFHRKMTYALTEPAIMIWHINMVTVVWIDTLVGA